MQLHTLHTSEKGPVILWGMYEFRERELLNTCETIERLTGDGDRNTLLAPLWSLDKRAVLGGIMKRQKQLDSIQGARFRED